MPKFCGENFHGWLSNREIRESFSSKVSRYTVHTQHMIEEMHHYLWLSLPQSSVL